MKTLVSIALSLLLAFDAVSKPQVTPVRPQPQVVAEIGVGLGIVAAGVVIVYGLNKISRALNPPPEAPPIQVPVIPPIIIFSAKAQAGAFPMVFQFDDSGVREYSVASSNWFDPGGSRYLYYFKSTVQSSEDLKVWTNECSVVGYCSAASVLTVWSDGAGVPFWTNYCSAGTRSDCQASIELPPDRKFFRTTAGL